MFKANTDLAKEIPHRDWVGYPLCDPFLSFHLLNSACNALSRLGQVVLTNNGPKLFGLLCFLVAARQPTASVWRISSGDAGAPVDCEPARDPYLVTTSWRRSTVESDLLLSANAPLGGSVFA